jgi:alpha-L-fucosidase 2
LQINEGSLWGGSPADRGKPSNGESLSRVQQLVFAGDIAGAETAAQDLLGNPKLLSPYQPFCDISLRFPEHGAVHDYRRELQLDDAVATVSYRIGDTGFRREAFVSHPDHVLVVRLTADKPGSESLTIGMDSPQPGASVRFAGPDGVHLSGQIQARTNPVGWWIGSWTSPGLKFAAHLLVRAQGGTVRRTGDRLEVTGADTVTLLFGNATSFRSYKDIGGDADGAAVRVTSGAAALSYEDLKRRHVADFSGLFSRVRLQLGPANAGQAPTAERLRSFSTTQDPSLVALYYQFGRYLLISASRPGGQAANLQGLWNKELEPPWGSKWTTNINLQMNYWPADSGNLRETQSPLWSLIRDLRITGSETARSMYGSGGWVLHHNTDLWRTTTPVDGVWGIWPVGAAWLSNQMWDHFQYTQDRRFLRLQAYPAMKEAARFFLRSLVRAPAGTRFSGALVTNPSMSPENQYVHNGYRAYLTYAPTMDIELIAELFEHCNQAAEELGIDAEFRAEIARARALLPPLQVGGRGQLQEWIEDYVEAEPTHRHVSHLYALYPGSSIDPEATPRLASAARKTLELRGDAGEGGWPKAWRVALWARLGDGERAYGNLRSLIADNSWPNMFNFGPPFQIDGNFGGAAGVSEMLLQSQHGTIRLLPAIPDIWRDGEVQGLRVRGAATVGFEWHDGKLTHATILGDVAATFRIRYADREAEVKLQPGKVVAFDGNLALTTG